VRAKQATQQPRQLTTTNASQASNTTARTDYIIAASTGSNAAAMTAHYKQCQQSKQHGTHDS
jgi:hypothetical protein